MLKYPVYVRSISNLSDARYCAGMGVELLGFCFDEQNGISIQAFESIKGWLSGVKIVAEFYNSELEYIQKVISEIKPDYVSVLIQNCQWEEAIEEPIIYFLNLDAQEIAIPETESMIVLHTSKENQNLFDKKELIKELIEKYEYNLFFDYGINKSNVDEVFKHLKPYGISLKGGSEIAPGLKSFDELANILEAIEVE